MDHVTAFHHVQKKGGNGVGNELEKMTLTVTEDFNFVDEDELLTAEEWQHTEVEHEVEEIVKRENEKKKKKANVLLRRPVNHMVILTKNIMLVT
jgi:hypothetical protein